MKKMMFLAALAALSVASTADGAEHAEYYGCDFSEGIPTGMSLADVDGQTLHYTMTQRGFSSTDSWRIMREEWSENLFAASASRFKTASGETAAPASDWMVLPRIWIRGGEASISWRSRIFNDQSSRPSRYEVRVSEKGSDPADFSGAPALVVTEEMEEWASHSLDLSDYKGRHVWIAFVNVTDNGEILGIDDISVSGDLGIAELSLYPGEYAFNVDNGLQIGGHLTAGADTPVTSFSASCLVREQSYDVDFPDLDLAPGESMEFSFPVTLDVAYGEKVDYVVNAVVNGTVFDPVAQSTTCLAFLPERKVVMEEATGTWCQYCPMGTLALKIIHEKYPDSFIPIAVHMMEGVDPMALDSYANQETFGGGAPSAWVDRRVYSTKPMVPTRIDNERTYTTLLGGFETLFLERLAQTPLAEVSVTASIGDDGMLEVGTQSRFPLDIEDADYRLCIVLTEDHVTGSPADGYRQANGYAGISETIGGYESLPQIIVEDLEFNHVARAIYDNYNGIPASLPSSLKVGEVYSWSRSFTLPKSVHKTENLNVVAMLLDHSSGEILNASSVRPAVSGINEVEASGLRVVAGDGRISVSVSDHSLPLNVELLDVSGRILSRSEGLGETSISTAGLRGLHLLRVGTATTSTTRKLIL